MVLENVFDNRIIEFLKGDERKKQRSLYKNYNNGIVRFHPERVLMPMEYLTGAQKVFDVKPKKDDVLVLTYPKCGTTWTQEIIWTLRNNANLDHPKAHLGINFRCPFLECDFISDSYDLAKLLTLDNPFVKEFLEVCPEGDYLKPMFIQLVETMPTPRTMKSHMTLSFLNPKFVTESKIVYVIRNPKDACVSYMHHNKLFMDVAYSGDMETHVNYFINDDLLYGGYANHLKEAWKLRNNPNFKIMFFEEMKANPEEGITELASFLGLSLTQEQLKKIVHYTSFGEMKKRDAIFTNNSSSAGFYVEEVFKETGGFFRKGKVGDHKESLSVEQSLKIDDWMEKQFNNSEFKCLYDILKKYSK